MNYDHYFFYDPFSPNDQLQKKIIAWHLGLWDIFMKMTEFERNFKIFFLTKNSKLKIFAWQNTICFSVQDEHWNQQVKSLSKADISR